ncbi:MAG: sulfite exporter TauE/SafE family protein [Acidobacteriota bacterium]|nr:sulfite exporter TauE/SafE family protein [Acidobacteriota bacterium]
MPTELPTTFSLLLGTAGVLATFHTLIGVDHSLPFIALGRARGWNLRRTLVITGACGFAHVASSVLIGLVGVGLGVALDQLSWLESARGEVAASLMIGFGLAYAAWAVWRGMRGQRHTHVHAHPDGTVHIHHQRHGEHRHPHRIDAVTPWALFLILAFGPCEALIPLMLVPALDQSWWQLSAVIVVFGVFTVGTMLVTVTLGYLGLSQIRFAGIERRLDELAGLTVAASGVAVLWFGL